MLSVAPVRVSSLFLEFLGNLENFECALSRIKVYTEQGKIEEERIVLLLIYLVLEFSTFSKSSKISNPRNAKSSKFSKQCQQSRQDRCCLVFHPFVFLILLSPFQYLSPSPFSSSSRVSARKFRVLVVVVEIANYKL